MQSQFRSSSPRRIVQDMKPLLFHEGALYCTRFHQIFKTVDWGKTFDPVGRLDLRLSGRPIMRQSKFLQRLARAQVYRMRVLPNGNRVYVFRGGIYTQPAGQDIAERSLEITRGSRPVSLASTTDGLVVFGEYWDNGQREPVHIFGSDDGGLSWRVLYMFDAGAIRHVHGISYDRFEDCFWICTGDRDGECRLVRASPDFSDMRVVRQGGQRFRFYSLTVAEDVLLTSTDSPNQPNQICIYYKDEDRLERVADIENSSFYGCLVGRQAFVSTNAEASVCNDETASHVWTGSLDHGDWRHLFRFPVDLPYRLSQSRFVPDGLFQFSRIYFPEGENPSTMLVCYSIGVLPYRYSMMCYDQEAWRLPRAA